MLCEYESKRFISILHFIGVSAYVVDGCIRQAIKIQQDKTLTRTHTHTRAPFEMFRSDMFRFLNRIIYQIAEFILICVL